MSSTRTLGGIYGYLAGRDLATSRQGSDAVRDDLTVAFGSVWVPNRTDGSVTRIDEATGEVIDTYGLKDGVWVAEAVGDRMWILDFSGNTIFVIDRTVTR